MTLTKNKMVREIGRRTRLKNRDVQVMLEALVEIWTEELVCKGRIELENFLVLEVKEIDRGLRAGQLATNRIMRDAPQKIYRVFVRLSRELKKSLNEKTL